MGVRLPQWLRAWLEPDEVIGQHEMLRWFIVKSRYFAVYVHKHQGDDARFLHDHPAANLSIRLAGTLIEYTPDDVAWHRKSARPIERYECALTIEHEGQRVFMFPDGKACAIGAPMPRFRFRRATDPHRLEAKATGPAWTIWVRGPCRRRWGYFTPEGWRVAVTKNQPAAPE